MRPHGRTLRKARPKPRPVFIHGGDGELGDIVVRRLGHEPLFDGVTQFVRCAVGAVGTLGQLLALGDHLRQVGLWRIGVVVL